MIPILNQIFELQSKMTQLDVLDKFSRNINKLHHICLEEGYSIHDPIGEKYNDSRTDCEASIVGTMSDSMYISQVIKPIIYHMDKKGEKTIVQKGIVLVESK